MTAFFDLKDYVQSTDDIVARYVVPVLLNKFLYDTEHKHIKGCMKYDDMCDNISVWIKVFQEKMFMTFFEKRISHKSLVEFVEFSKRFMKNFDSAHVNKKVKYVLNSSTYVSMHKNPDEEIVICFTKK